MKVLLTLKEKNDHFTHLFILQTFHGDPLCAGPCGFDKWEHLLSGASLTPFCSRISHDRSRAVYTFLAFFTRRHVFEVIHGVACSSFLCRLCGVPSCECIAVCLSVDLSTDACVVSGSGCQESGFGEHWRPSVSVPIALMSPGCAPGSGIAGQRVGVYLVIRNSSPRGLCPLTPPGSV